MRLCTWCQRKTHMLATIEIGSVRYNCVCSDCRNKWDCSSEEILEIFGKEHIN